VWTERIHIYYSLCAWKVVTVFAGIIGLISGKTDGTVVQLGKPKRKLCNVIIMSVTVKLNYSEWRDHEIHCR
jgi:hypothetical protein